MCRCCRLTVGYRRSWWVERTYTKIESCRDTDWVIIVGTVGLYVCKEDVVLENTEMEDIHGLVGCGGLLHGELIGWENDDNHKAGGRRTCGVV